MAEARKLIETKKEGEFEIQKYHVLYFELDRQFLEEIFESEMEDYEEAYSIGICGDFDGDIFAINVDELLPYITRKDLDDFEEDFKREDYDKLIKILEPYKGYTIYPQSNNEETETKNKRRRR